MLNATSSQPTQPPVAAAPASYITGEWSHLFPCDKGERRTRIVVNATEQKLIQLQVQVNRAILDSFRPATPDELADVEDSLINANGELFDNPADYGLSTTTEIPAWASSGFKVKQLVFYKQDPGTYGAITITDMGNSKVEGYSGHRQMSLPFDPTDLCTADELITELEALIFDSTDVMFKREKILARICALKSAAILAGA